MGIFEHIVTIVDGSPTSDYAIGASITLAKELDSSIHFCLTLDPMLCPEEVGMQPFAELAYEQKAQMLRAAHARAEQNGITGTTGSIINDTPAQGILSTAHSEQADLIVMGLAPRIGILRPFMRSLVEAVLAQTTIPLCVMRRPTRGMLQRRILVPIVNDELSRIGVAEAVRMARDLGSTLVFCSLATASTEAAAGEAVAFGLAEAEKAGVRAESLVAETGGRVGTTIIRDADIRTCDAIVMASHARQGLARLVEGSVTEAVITQSDVPVIIVRKP